MLIDKSRHWAGLAVAVFLNTNAAVFYELLTCYLGKVRQCRRRWLGGLVASTCVKATSQRGS